MPTVQKNPDTETTSSTPITISSMAREALTECGGSTDAAIAVVIDRLSSDVDLLRSIVRDAIKDAVGMRVEMAMRSRRASIIASTTGTRGAVIALANGVIRALLDMPLANGVPLRMATRDQVTEQADRYASTAKDATHKAKWLRAIAQSIPGDMRVGDVITDERAAELYRETGI